jgi:TorA maturation chaperone TorD
MELLRPDEQNRFLVSLGMARLQFPASRWEEYFVKGWRLLENLSEGGYEDCWEEFQVEHTRLFFGPPSPAVPPFEHYYRERARPGELCLELDRSYRSFGFGLDPQFGSLPDHICAELEYESALLERGEDASAEEFRGKHLQEFMLLFGAKLVGVAREEFFSFLGEVILGLTKEPHWGEGTLALEDGR